MLTKTTTSLLITRRLLSTSSVRRVNITQVSYEKLLQADSDDMLEVIERAYSENGLGSLAISGVPQYMEHRKKTLLLAY
jgi:hypothetical protein